eukprot:s3345_g3.t1
MFLLDLGVEPARVRRRVEENLERFYQLRRDIKRRFKQDYEALLDGMEPKADAVVTSAVHRPLFEAGTFMVAELR